MKWETHSAIMIMKKINKLKENHKITSKKKSIRLTAIIIIIHSSNRDKILLKHSNTFPLLNNK